MNPQDQNLNNTKTLILEQSAHCDWDWWNTFLGYFKDGFKPQGHAPVEQTLTSAISLMSSQPGKYFYTFCEMAYLKQYVEDNPSQVSVIKSVAESFTLVSGGMTSADNLLSHGEAFIRNYLLGRHWAIHELGITPTKQMWIPDDFGHDAQLPIVLQAMGFTGAGFWRIPGDQPGLQGNTTIPADAPSSILTSSVGLDFIWQASDGSQVQAHWLSNSYCEGNALCTSNGVTLCTNTVPWDTYTQTTINQFITDNLSPAKHPTPYLFVPVDCDFATPYNNLPDIINSWNSGNQNPGNCKTTQPTQFNEWVAEMGSFDHFMHLVHEYTKPGNPNNAALEICYSNPPNPATDILFMPNPFFAGCYGSRPELKLMHYQTTRTLLLAESMEIFLEYLAFKNASQWSQTAADMRKYLAEGWLELVPSTHHDYITGTAVDLVYQAEQFIGLQTALSDAQVLSIALTQQLAGAATASTGDVTALVFNSLGFARSGVVEIDSPGPGLQSAIVDGQNYFPVQYNESTNTLLFMVENNLTKTGVPSLGYSTVSLTTHAPTVSTVLSVGPTSTDVSYFLENEFISAVISPTGITELYDLINDPTKQNNLMGSGGSQIVFYNDSGNIYRFGNELPTGNTFYLDNTVQANPQALSITEQGLLRCTLTTTTNFTVDKTTFPFTTTYSLVAGEPFLRIAITGAAPSGYSVMAKLSFPSTIDTLTYGTPYHWDTRQPRNYIGWPSASTPNVEGMTFEPTHEFVIPAANNGNYLAAIYHAGTPGWAIDSNGDLLGCILRNTPGTQQAASGTDSASHTASFALRVAGTAGSATQLLSPEVGCSPGGPLGEALQFNNPMVGAVVPANASGELPFSSMSIAETSDPRAVITTAKMGTYHETDLILRVYQPTNSQLEGIEVSLDPNLAPMFQSGTLNVAGQTALETKLEDSLSLQASATSFTFTAPFAITTFALSRETDGE